MNRAKQGNTVVARRRLLWLLVPSILLCCVVVTCWAFGERLVYKKTAEYWLPKDSQSRVLYGQLRSLRWQWLSSWGYYPGYRVTLHQEDDGTHRVVVDWDGKLTPLKWTEYDTSGTLLLQLDGRSNRITEPPWAFEPPLSAGAVRRFAEYAELTLQSAPAEGDVKTAESEYAQ